MKIESSFFVAVTLSVWANPANADGYLNCAATESAVNADADTLMCEDFESTDAAGGNWYGEDCDTANSNGGIVARTKGWCGTIYANPITPSGASTCGGVGVGSGCVGDHGELDGQEGGRNMADHDFVDQGTVTELYVRYYQKWLAGYQFGAEKVLTFNESAGSGGIKWGNLHINCGAGASGPTGSLQWQPVGGGFDSCFDITSVTSGVWYAIQIHAVLSTTQSSDDGLLQVWVDDCGESGASCPATPTLRLEQTNMSWDRNGESEQFGALWWENWANPGSTGTSYVDQIVVSKSGPIGFMGASGAGGDAGSGGASSGGSAGSGGSGGNGGNGTGGGSSGGAANGGASATPSSEDDGGCGCRMIRTERDTDRGAIALLVAAMIGVGFRRWRRGLPKVVAAGSLVASTLGFAQGASANEERCQDLGANCVCAEPFDTTVFDLVNQSWFDPADTTTQECSTEGIAGGALTRNSSDVFGSSDAAAIAALPPGHQIEHFVALPDGHAGTFTAGHTLGDQFLKRSAARWYIYHSPDFAFSGEGECKNSKLAQFNSGLLLDKSFGPVHAYNFLTWSCASTPCNVPVDCCMSGPGPANVDKPDWRGNWLRIEVVFVNREGGTPGFDMKVYLQNVTTGEPEITVVDLQLTSSEWAPSASLLPPDRMDGMTSNNHRDGTCPGWLGLSHYMAAGWDTDEGQRIGPAVEIEGQTAGGAGAGGGSAVGGSAGGGGTGNTPGAGGSSGTGNQSGSGGQPASGDASGDDSGCGCRVAPRDLRQSGIALFFAFGALVARRRRATYQRT